MNCVGNVRMCAGLNWLRIVCRYDLWY